MGEENKEISVNEKSVVNDDNLNQLSTEVLEKMIQENIEKFLSGKCPVRVNQEDGKIQWKDTYLRKPFQSFHKAIENLTATTDPELAQDIVYRGATALPNYDDNAADAYNTTLQSLADFSPRDAIEARLCAQATALYSNGMNLIGNANYQKMIPQQSHFMKYGLKLLRLHNETIEALAKYRRGGEQKVVVQHVNVNDGGQAAIMAGNFQAGGGGKIKNED